MPDLEIDLLRGFATVAESGSFTAAAVALNLTQSAVSQQIKRLEGLVGKELLERSRRRATLTPEGETLYGYARRVLALNDEAVRRLAAPPMSGVLRLGVSEDFLPLRLPALLAGFAKAYPGIQLELTTGLSTALVGALASGLLDFAIAKRDAHPHTGRVIWREKLVWAAGAALPTEPLPLVLLPPPCSYRRLMLDTLAAAGRPWRVACTAHSLMGMQAAVAGGLGVSVLGRSFMQSGLRDIGGECGLPDLPDTEIALFGENGARAELVECALSFLLEGLPAGANPKSGGSASRPRS
ncbi:LysR substrate-binding domain-containing protein [Fundidesulfovibrio soli]|uniref:LysR substrate-binding domain-containing protein n=1 Tax=Fundidesulfovibrio soli TaxID=2922716 RepID=UPI001FAF92F6|nr:LysR substrate-binding domain-containing protein [Fundidesulfovibrio soli]